MQRLPSLIREAALGKKVLKLLLLIPFPWSKWLSPALLYAPPQKKQKHTDSEDAI